MNINQLQSIIFPFLKGDFNLPIVSTSGNRLVHIVGVSSGIDSTATALILKALFPDTRFLFVFTEVKGWEVEGTKDAIEKLESFLGQKIVRPTADLGLLEYIQKAGGFLPSQRQRFCTSAMKILPMARYMKYLRESLVNVEFAQYVGIRADEQQRDGAQYNGDDTTTYFPLQALGLDKSAVNSIVESTVGIPSYYFEKSRSGCTVCIFSRRAEIIDAWGREPAKVYEASKLEIMPSDVIQIFHDFPVCVSEQTGISRNWLYFVRPDWLGHKKMGYMESQRGKNNTGATQDMFAVGTKYIYVAVEYAYTLGYGFMPDSVYFERIVTYSTSLTGLKIALKHFWLHRLHTRELYGSKSDDDLAFEKQIAIMQIEIDDFEDLIPNIPNETFTWQGDRTPLLAIRKTMAIIEHILLVEGLKQEGVMLDSDEEGGTSIPAITKITREYGRVLHYEKYDQPSISDLTQDMDIEDAPVACIQCSR